MEWFTYIILECKDGSYYTELTGITRNLKRRIKEHNQGIKTCLQKSKIPSTLVYWERCKNQYKAAKREREIKGWRREKKENLIKSLH